ncbi:uncharacterized protein BJ212DRAFT_1298092 [Suillus subaureus]|uniref:SAP domain-containing protein n=1 Tax=Suillus subaureus TaxID=48587 RepID=A0A9P7JFS3_9AGAM|nr:uncharacterized protein BJ212DRAFT_1298092 [Suillus subaureus]KAG1819641.1 hypothetical protein BJ212DRAFT_1298092 [Suillus subaureus]
MPPRKGIPPLTLRRNVRSPGTASLVVHQVDQFTVYVYRVSFSSTLIQYPPSPDLVIQPPNVREVVSALVDSSQQEDLGPYKVLTLPVSEANLILFFYIFHYQLQAPCREHGLNLRGRKADLIERLAVAVSPSCPIPSKMLTAAVTEASQMTAWITKALTQQEMYQDDEEPVVQASGPCLVTIDDAKVWHWLTAAIASGEVPDMIIDAHRIIQYLRYTSTRKLLSRNGCERRMGPSLQREDFDITENTILDSHLFPEHFEQVKESVVMHLTQRHITRSSAYSLMTLWTRRTMNTFNRGKGMTDVIAARQYD